ncbi:MAG: hypothetical protein H9949_03275 [Candidatus Phocaeicola merdigallinarum]|nr:hypothetical protein [Candidatus Phocaeicola merdigallinarum]
MKQFDLKQIMKDAWRTYKYVAKKKGKTFGEVLKSTWRLAKLQVSMKKAMDTKREPLAGLQSDCKAVSYDWSGVTEAAIYPDNNSGYLGSKYCGD